MKVEDIELSKDVVLEHEIAYLKNEVDTLRRELAVRAAIISKLTEEPAPTSA